MEFRVRADEANQRLDKIVAGRVQSIGRRRARELLRAGSVLLNGRRGAKSDRPRPGDVVRLLEIDPERPAPSPEVPLDVRAESEHWIVLSKPEGQPSVPLRTSERGTLANALLGHYPELEHVGSRLDAGLIQRLDTQTSGLIVAARTASAYARLRQALTSGQITKRYYAIVPQATLPGSGVIDWAIGPDRRNRRRVRVDRLQAIASQQAATEWRVAERGANWALLEVSVSRAYRHQIRAHLAELGHPIAGDELYGSAPCPALEGRHALHACYVAWAGDEDMRGFEVDDPLPESLARLLGVPRVG